MKRCVVCTLPSMLLARFLCVAPSRQPARCWTTCSSCGIAPLLQADSRASPRLELFATDASPFGAGGCVAPVTAELWRTFHNLAEEQGQHVRLSLGSSPPPLELTPSRCACAALVTPANWFVLFKYQFRAPDHFNVLELTALTSLVKHLANRGARKQRILCCVDSCVVLGAVSNGRDVEPNPAPARTSYQSLRKH